MHRRRSQPVLHFFTSLFNGRARVGRVLAGCLLLMLFSGTVQAEGISVQASDKVVAASPENVRITFDAPPDLSTTHLDVFTVNHEPVEVGPLRTTADPLTI